MFFIPNLSGRERALRLLFGVALTVVGALFHPAFVRWSLWAAAVISVGTAGIAFCPVTAMAGRSKKGKIS